ncbi:MAG: hypothetical protein JST15_04950 [Bacteroidetes bacterium]|nr:hypothetical protein [Bacteroidota bacterium]
MVTSISILKEFSIEELKRFERFLSSPYYNCSKKVTNLFKELKKFHPAFDSPNLTKEYLSSKISPSLAYKDSTIRNLLADLQGLIEKFLIVEKVFSNGFEKDILALNSFIEKKQIGLFDLTVNRTLEHIECEGIDGDYYYFKSCIMASKFNHNLSNGNEKSQHTIESNIQILRDYCVSLLSFSISEIIQSYLKLNVQESKYLVAGNTSDIQRIIEALNINDLIVSLRNFDKDNFIVDLYGKLYYMFKHMEDIGYQEYKSCVSKFSKKMSKDELSYHYSMLISYCIIKYSLSSSKLYYNQELFGIYNTLLKEKLFLDRKSKHISEELFRNILVLSLRLKKFDWTLSFINNYSKYMHPQKIKNMRNLSYAEYYYHMGCNNNSQDLLKTVFDYITKISDESFIIKYDIRILYLMLYYDLNDFDGLLSEMKNFRQFLQRNSLVVKSRKQKLFKSLNILEKLIYLKEGNPNIDIVKLNMDVQHLSNFNYQQWLYDRVDCFTNKSTFSKLRHG